MKIIHVGQKAKQREYADIGEIVQEISLTLGRSEGTPHVLQIYTYPEEAFMKKGTRFFSQEEIENLCRDLRSLTQNYPCAVLCLGILRSETIEGKIYLINSALMFHKQDFTVFDKQVIYSEDTLWKHFKNNPEQHFIGDYLEPIIFGNKNIDNIDIFTNKLDFKHTHFNPMSSDGTPQTPRLTTSKKCHHYNFPAYMLASALMSRTMGVPADWRWKNYMLIPTPEMTVAIWVGICKEIPTRSFLQRYEYWRPQIKHDATVAIILANDLSLGSNSSKGGLPTIPLLVNDKNSNSCYTGMLNMTRSEFMTFEDGIIEV